MMQWIRRRPRISPILWSGNEYTINSRFFSRRGDNFRLQLLARLYGELVGYLLKTGFLKNAFQKRSPVLVIIGLPFFGFATYIGSHAQVVPVSNRIQLVFLQSDEENDLAKEAEAMVLRKEQKSFLSVDSDVYKTTKSIIDDIVAACVESNIISAKREFKLYVIDSPITNAFVLPNGSIFVYTGLLQVAQNHGGLACVIGHEISHALARHSAEKLGIIDILAIIYQFIRGVGDSNRTWKQQLFEFFVINIISIGLPLAYSRHMEREADRIGLTISAHAGYDPRQAPLLWQRMDELEHKMMEKVSKLPSTGKNGDLSSSLQPQYASSSRSVLKTLLSTHPSSESRALDLAALAETLIPEYLDAVDKRSLLNKPVLNSEVLLPGVTVAKKETDWDGFDESVYESCLVAMNSAALMVGAKGDGVKAFLKELGREQNIMGVEGGGGGEITATKISK